MQKLLSLPLDNITEHNLRANNNTTTIAMKKRSINICLGSSCFSRGNKTNLEVIKTFLAENKLDASLEVSGHLCKDKCDRGPVIIIDETEYEAVTLSGLHRILQEEFIC